MRAEQVTGTPEEQAAMLRNCVDDDPFAQNQRTPRSGAVALVRSATAAAALAAGLAVAAGRVGGS